MKYRPSLRPTALGALVAVCLCSGAWWTHGTPASRGVPIAPDSQRRFHFTETFETLRFLEQGFVSNLGVEFWQPGALITSGPNRNRTLTYRFFGTHPIEAIRVRVEQTANGPNLGGVNHLYVSDNGLDWVLASSSGTQRPDAGGWQREPLEVPERLVQRLVGATEFWVRLVLDNTSGLKTGTSNTIHKIEVALEVGGATMAPRDPQAAARAFWGRLRQQARWSSCTLDWADPPGSRPPFYFEEADGWLERASPSGAMTSGGPEGFEVRRAYESGRRLPLSLTGFVRTFGGKGGLMAQIVVRSTPESSRRVHVSWDGRRAATFDAARAFEEEQAFFIRLPAPEGPGVHALRIAGADSGPVLIRRVSLAGAGSPVWVPRPPLAPGSLTVLGASYLPDGAPPAASQAVEGRQQGQDVGLTFGSLQRLYREHGEFGALRVVLRNGGRTPVRIGGPLLLNGRPIEQSYVDFVHSEWDAPGVVWYRVRPRTVGPGQCAQVYVRFRRRPSGSGARLVVPLENGPAVPVRIPYRTPTLSVDYVTTGSRPDVLYLYARAFGRGREDPVVGATLDGVPPLGLRVFGGQYPGGVSLVVARLRRPLRLGAHHVAGVRTRSGLTTHAQFRVLPFWFPRSSIHVPPERCGPMQMNLAMWFARDLATCRKHDIYTTSVEVFDQHPRVSFIIGPDEPDAHDDRGGGYPRGLGVTARGLAHGRWQELIERYAPQAASWIIMNGTVRPLNWWVYGQLADITCFDPYPVTYYGADHAYVRESLGLARQAGAPKRMFACLEAYGWRSGQGVPTGARGPSPAEYRQNVVQAVGAGMKGLTSWVYSAGAGGWELNPAVAREIARMNAILRHIEADLILGTPVDLATTDAGRVPTGTIDGEGWPKERVWVGSLLCGPDTIVLAAANHIPASKTEPTIEPARDVTITVSLPPYLPRVSAFEATEEGLHPYPCSPRGSKALLRLAEIESGRIFVLRRSPVATSASEARIR